MRQPYYICIDLKSFYASVECVERGLDPMTTNLVVADLERTDKTICLAITPAMKALGIPNRCRVFEIPDNVKYIAAVPRMQRYIDYAAEIYGIYLKYFSKDDIHVYSIDEAFIDVTQYLNLYNMDAITLGRTVVKDIYDTLGITATCGVGTNLYLTKIALDITAKHSEDFIGFLDEDLYRETLHDHQPLTDFWRIGSGICKKLNNIGIYTMKDICEADEDLLYSIFGVDAELLIDHAHGIEPTTIKDIKNYKPKNNCISSGQVLSRDYNFDEGLLIIKEMADSISLELLSQKLITDSITMHIGYSYNAHTTSAHGTASLDISTNSNLIISPALVKLYQDIVDPRIPIRRVSLTANKVSTENFTQYSFFVDNETISRNKSMQEAILNLKDRFGNNAVFRGMDMCEGATTLERNNQIGGHRSGKETNS